MKGDFSRWSFDPKKHFSRVLMQQGRVQLDADWNEQGSIFLYYLRTLATDLIGRHGGPEGDDFKIVSCLKDSQPIDCDDPGAGDPTNTFYVLPGHYYVDGILCEHDGKKVFKYEDQPGCSADDLRKGYTYLAYLDVWERHITYYEDEVRADDPSIREVALGRVDTATRAKVVRQVKVIESTIDDDTIRITKYSDILQSTKSILGNVTKTVTGLGWLVDEARLLLSNPPAGNRTMETVLSDINNLLDKLYTDVDNGPKSYVTRLKDLIGQLPANTELSEQMISFKKHLETLAGFTNSTNFPRFNPPTQTPSQTALDSFQINLSGLTTMIQALELEINDLIKAYKQDIEHWLQNELSRQIPYLKARAESNGNGSSNETCTIPPDAQYRGPENRLYRVEIHRGSTDDRGNAQMPTFKWSRENGSIAFRIEKAAGKMLTLKDWWPDSHHGLKRDDWIEIIDDEKVLGQRPGLLAKVSDIDDVAKTVTVTTNANIPDYDETDSDKHPLLRRWDQGSDAIAINTTNYEFKLEDGIVIEFIDPATSQFRTGDYWLIPARTEIGNVIWPGPTDNPEAQPPLGIDHHYAPLAIIEVNEGKVKVIADCRRLFPPLGQPVGA